MKYLIVGILACGLAYLIFLQQDSFNKQREFIKDCEAKKGFVTEVSSGWVTKTLMCNK